MPHAPQRKVAACRGSDPGRSTFVLPENDVLVDKVAQRSVHGLHAPHVKLPRLPAAARRLDLPMLPLRPEPRGMPPLSYSVVVHKKNLPASLPGN